MLNLDHIATFMAVVRASNFRAAARELGLSQGAVSQHLRKLETALGVRLLARQARGCAMTREGAELLPFAEGLLRLSARAIALREPRIALGASSNIGVYLLHPSIKSWLLDTGGRYPVDTQIHANPAIAQKLEASEIDVALMEWWDGRTGYVARLWRREELVAIVPPDHPWIALPCIEPELLKTAAILGGEPGTGTGRLLARYLGSQGLKVAMRLGSTEAVKQWVRAGLGVSLVLAATVEHECREGTLVAIRLASEPVRKELYVIWRESLAHASPARQFGEWLSGRS